MKRLVPFLILVAFFLGLPGSRGGPAPVQLRFRTCVPSYPQFSKYIPRDEFSNKWDVSEELPSPPNNSVFFKPSQKNFIAGDFLSPTPPKHYTWLGYGCGGLPS
jgi:hypothetical protein